MTNYQPYNKKPYVNQIKGKSDWKDNDLIYHRMDIAEYLFNINNKKCFYCENEINRDISVEHIEHIVDKKDYSQFAYNPKNLTLSCPLCNTKKSTQNVLNIDLSKNCSHDEYPNDSQDYMIVHAYFDDRAKCISTLDDIIYIGIDERGKGYNTIKMCGINEVVRLEYRVKKIKNKKQTLVNIIETIKDSKYAQLNMEELVNKVFDELVLTRDIETLDEEIVCINSESKKLNDFINNLRKDKTLLANNIIDEICEINLSEFENIKNIYDVCENKLKGIDIDLLSLDKEDKDLIADIDNSIKVLNIIACLFRKKEYRNVMPFLINIEEYNGIIELYEKITNNNPDDLYAKLFLSSRWIIEICRMYIYNLETKEIKDGYIDNIIKACEELKSMFKTA